MARGDDRADSARAEAAEGEDDDAAAIIERARRGDNRAWATLYHRYARTVHACLLARVPSVDVDDLVQDTFALAVARIASLDDSERFAGWLMTIARHRAVDYWRRVKPTIELPEYVAVAPIPRPEANQVLRAIRELPEAYREPLVMRLVAQMTGPEIAEATGLTHGSVRVNLSRGMKLLRERLGVLNDD